MSYLHKKTQILTRTERHICMVKADYDETCDKMKHDKIMKLLEDINIDDKGLNKIKNIY